MNSIGAEKYLDVRDGLLALLKRVDKVERQSGADLMLIRAGIESLLEKLGRETEQPRSRESAVMAFDRLLGLDMSFAAVVRDWTEVRKIAGVAAADELIKDTNLDDGWHARWGDSSEYARRVRSDIEERETRERPRGGSTGLPSVSALDLRYGAGLPLTRIAELFNLSVSAVQGRVATFESRVANEIAAAMIQGQLRDGWQLASQSDANDFELVQGKTNGRVPDVPIHLRIVPVWTDLDGSAGRPRETGIVLGRASGVTRIWVVVFFTGPRVVYVPEQKLHAYTRGTAIMRHAPIDKIIQLAPELGYENLPDALLYITWESKALEVSK